MLEALSLTGQLNGLRRGHGMQETAMAQCDAHGLRARGRDLPHAHRQLYDSYSLYKDVRLLVRDVHALGHEAFLLLSVSSKRPFG